MPTAVWIWDISKLRLAVVMQQISAVAMLCWHPSQPLLAVCTGSGAVYFWSPNGCLCAQVPTDREFSVNAMEWSADGEALVLIDNDRFCVSFPQGGLQALVNAPDAPADDAALPAEQPAGAGVYGGGVGFHARAHGSGGGGGGGGRGQRGVGLGGGAAPIGGGTVVVGGTSASRGIDRANAAFAEMQFGSSRSGVGAAGRSARY